MNHFEYHGGILHAEDVPLPQIAEAVGTPVYVYSQATIERHARVFRSAVAGTGRGEPICAFAIKANPNLAVLHIMAREGFGADVVSGGELERAITAGMPPERIIFSGVGKTDAELALGLARGIGQFNIESEAEGLALAGIATARGQTANAVLRVNPDVDAQTHAKISTGKAENKFGVPIDQAHDIFARLTALPGLNLRGVALHIGSMIAELGPLEAAFKRIGALLVTLRAAGHNISHVDLGGGLGAPYKPDDVFPSPEDYGAMVRRVTSDWEVQLVFEPGRVIVANAGVLLTRVIRVKPGMSHPFVIVDAAMNDLARPAMYDAYHHFESVMAHSDSIIANIVGPICESSDTFAMERSCTQVEAGDLAVFRSAGAYGATMASTYNSRDMVPEVLVSGDKFAIVADRIAAATIMAAERVPDWI
ncbi:MAG: diaminopimelate decarboxylase [Alphaproteobacteria bacterium]|nr:diaminopimelate decarboxylase [Alphaproteobacteria bacterium]MDE2340654.1 diaminopimelate decarboxylase [Alphaproteobacteria bacterium]